LFRFAKFLGILTLESFASSALGLAVGSIAPSTEAALAMGPAVRSKPFAAAQSWQSSKWRQPHRWSSSPCEFSSTGFADSQVMVIFIVFGGVYVNATNVPTALKWLPNISMIKYCFEVPSRTGSCACQTVLPSVCTRAGRAGVGTSNLQTLHA